MIAEALGPGQWRVYGPLRERAVLRTISEARQVPEKRRAGTHKVALSRRVLGWDNPGPRSD